MPDYWHTANTVFVVPVAAVGYRRQSLRRVPTGLRRVPRAHGELVVSGSEPSSPEVGLVGLAFSSYASFVAISKI